MRLLKVSETCYKKLALVLFVSLTLGVYSLVENYRTHLDFEKLKSSLGDLLRTSSQGFTKNVEWTPEDPNSSGAPPYQADPKEMCEGMPDIGEYCECVNANPNVHDALREHFTLAAGQVDETVFKMNVYSKDDVVSYSIMQYKGWEVDSARKLLQALDEHYQRLRVQNPAIQKEDVKFLDIGANIGWYSIVMAMHGYGVLSFEPMQTNLLGFKNSVCANSLQHAIIIHETALSGEQKVCKLLSATTNVGDGFIGCESDWHSSISDYTFVFRHNVTFNKLDELVQEPWLIGAAKMDVEGFEAHVLAGGQQTLLQGGIPLIFAEYSPGMMRDAGSDPVEYLQEIHDAGYEIRVPPYGDANVVSTRDEFASINAMTEVYYRKTV